LDTGTNKIETIEKWAILLCLILLLPALIINLGLVPLIDDEAIRALVAMEMDFSEDYITPTIYGQLYLNKPPLYNWILLVSYKIFGVVSEFSSRVPTVVFLLGYGFAIYKFYSSELGKKEAIILALLSVTSGRIFFYDSLLGLIDILFSFLMFCLMISAIKLSLNKSWKLFYVSCYTLAGIGFMLKTLPAIVFLGISILVALFLEKELKKLFNPSHLLGMLCFAAIVFPYYYMYHEANGLSTLFERMYSESSKRTLLESSFLSTFKHLFEFPVDFLFNLLPWSVMVIYFFKKGMLKVIWNNKFLKANVCMLLANLVIYWLSPEIFARYLLMFPPLFLMLLLHLHKLHAKEKTIHYRVVQTSWILIVLITIGLALYGLFFENLVYVDLYRAKLATVTVACFLTLYFLIKSKIESLPLVILFVVLFRIGFDLAVLPHRAVNGSAAKLRNEAQKVVEVVKQEPLYLIQTEFLEQTMGFYITKGRKQPLTLLNEPLDRAYYFISMRELDHCKSLIQFQGRHKGNKYRLSKCN